MTDPVSLPLRERLNLIADGKTMADAKGHVADGYHPAQVCREAAAQIDTLERERDDWKLRWQNKADAFEVQEQSIAVLQSALAAVKAERDGRLASIAQSDAETEMWASSSRQDQKRAEAAESSSALLREALTAARRQLVTLAGDWHQTDKQFGDPIQAAILDQIDAALAGGSDGAE